MQFDARVHEPHRPVVTEGERWARAELERLRFTPAGVGAFLAASWRRSGEIRRARPELARRARGWMAVGGVLYLAAPVRLRPALAWWAACAVMLDWHLGMFETEDGQPRNLGPADALTLTRAWLVPLALDAPSPVVCLAAAATDTLDGPAARRAGPTRAGRDLEGLVDACFAAAALRGARRRGWLGRGPVAAEHARIARGLRLRRRGLVRAGRAAAGGAAARRALVDRAARGRPRDGRPRAPAARRRAPAGRLRPQPRPARPSRRRVQPSRVPVPSAEPGIR